MFAAIMGRYINVFARPTSNNELDSFGKRLFYEARQDEDARDDEKSMLKQSTAVHDQLVRRPGNRLVNEKIEEASNGITPDADAEANGHNDHLLENVPTTVVRTVVDSVIQLAHADEPQDDIDHHQKCRTHLFVSGALKEGTVKFIIIKL